ncbi:hypothetical protein ACWA5V_21465, partial [Xanthomonas citri pv. rhynchosiae]
AVSGREGWMVQPSSPALPLGPSVPQLAGWGLPGDASTRSATEEKCNERSAETMCQAKYQTYRNQQR